MLKNVRFVAFLISLFLIISLFSACGNGEEPIVETDPINVEYEPLSAGETQASGNIVGAIKGRTNDVLLYQNPDRGFRTTVPIVIHPEHPDPDDPTKTTDTCDLINRNANGKVSLNGASKCNGKHDVRHVFGNLDAETKKKAIDYSFQLIYLKTGKTDYNAKLLLMQGTFMGCNKSDTLPDYIFEALDMYFDNCRQYGIRVLFRYGYHCVQLNWQLNDTNKAEHLKYGASEEVMIAHTKQLAPYIAKNIDVIHKLSSGFIGSGGEMAFSYQYPVVDYNNVIKAVVENICVPNGLYFTVRMPIYKQNLLLDDPDYKYANIIGHNNDAMYGENQNYGWTSECYQLNHNFANPRNKCHEFDNGGTHFNNDQWEYVMNTAAYTPQSGEMFHYSATTHTSGAKKLISGFDMIKQVAHHRFTTMSQWNSFIESGYVYENGQQICAESVMQHWIDDELLTQEWLTENNIVYDPAWFYDDNGEEVLRNPFEFIRDHLGYKLTAEKFIIDKNKMALTLKNYGFAAAFTLESGFAVLDENYNVISEVKAGNPDTWYSHDPEDYTSNEVLEHTVSADLTSPETNGKYYIAFYLKNGMNEYARLSNDPESIPFEAGKYNILYSAEN